MARIALPLTLALALLAGPAPLWSQGVAADPEVVKGIRQVDEGDYDAAILTLDAATRQMVSAKKHGRELGQAYLYLGIAYLAKGHEYTAGARFRDALAQDRTITLTPDKFAPRMIELFEKAREEELGPAKSAQAAPKKGGSKKTLLFVGAGAAVAGGAALALGGGNADEGYGVVLSQSWNGLPLEKSRFFDVTLRKPGNLSVTVDWSDPGHDVDIYLTPPTCGDTDNFPPDVCQVLQRSDQANKPEMFVSAVNPGPYRIIVRYCCGDGTPESGTVQAVLSR